VRGLKKGQRVRKTVRGNTVAEDIEQLNLVIVKEGEKPIEEILGGGSEEGEGTS
jgi:small subunit ribosomal protein S6e